MPKAKTVKKAGNLKVTLRRGLSRKPPKLRRVLEGMGLTKINDFVILPDNDATRGMINKVPNLVEVQEVTGS
jgi:large subunit ribosomal protein L30